jgi:RsiW-degrading membrane proteinase PrsW (M82 family)
MSNNPYGPPPPPGGGGYGYPPRPPYPQSGQPSQQQPGPSQQQPGYSQQQPGYSQQQPGYSQQQPGYSQQQPGYPQQQPGYPQQQPGYPQQGYRPPGPQSPGGPPYGMPPYMAARVVGPVNMPNPERTRRIVGAVLYAFAFMLGLCLNFYFYLSSIFLAKNPGVVAGAMFTGFIAATLPLIVYLFVPAIIDRFDPEPWWCLALAFVWGAVVATGFAGLVNSEMHEMLQAFFGKKMGLILTVSVVAPICEEFMKGLAVFGAFYFLRREFDGVVDGIIYATFAALGFACIENVQYYARAELAHQLGGLFFIRGILAPWGHPLYTSMTGIGFGIARESTSTAVKFLAPLVGYAAGVLLHAIWNFVPTVLGETGFFILFPLWLLFVAAFFVMIIVLVYRKGKTIRENLRDEVLLGNLSQDEVELICSPVGRLRCTFSWRGATGRNFIGAGARLALSKWHTARAMRGSKRTVSADFIVPMRNEIKRLRGELISRMPR